MVLADHQGEIVKPQQFIEKERFDTVVTSLETVRATKEALEKRLAASEKQRESLCEQIVVLEKDEARLRQERDGVLEDKKKLVEEVARGESALASQDQTIAALRAQVASMGDEINALKVRHLSFGSDKIPVPPMPEYSQKVADWLEKPGEFKTQPKNGFSDEILEGTPLARKKGEGRKDDQGKLAYDLLPALAEESIVGVLTYGAKKYAPENWRKVPEAHRRYYAAARRHLAAWKLGEINDTDTNLPHLAHAACCVMFLLELDLEAVGK